MSTMIDKAKVFWDRQPELVVVGAAMAALLLFMAWAIPASIADQNAWELHCTRELGGHVVEHTSTGTAISPKDGSTSVTTSTTYYCLSPAGGILDIR